MQSYKLRRQEKNKGITRAFECLKEILARSKEKIPQPEMEGGINSDKNTDGGGKKKAKSEISSKTIRGRNGKNKASNNWKRKFLETFFSFEAFLIIGLYHYFEFQQ